MGEGPPALGAAKVILAHFHERDCTVGACPCCFDYLFEDYDKRNVHNVSSASASKFTYVMAYSNMQT